MLNPNLSKLTQPDTCDDIRRKISAHMQKSGVTQAQFLRDVAAQYTLKPRSIQSKQLNDFRSKKGPEAGNTSAVFYGSYVLFEMMRLKEGKPKSAARVRNEEMHGVKVVSILRRLVEGFIGLVLDCSRL